MILSIEVKIMPLIAPGKAASSYLKSVTLLEKYLHFSWQWQFSSIIARFSSKYLIYKNLELQEKLLLYTAGRTILC